RDDHRLRRRQDPLTARRAELPGEKIAGLTPGGWVLRPNRVPNLKGIGTMPKSRYGPDRRSAWQSLSRQRAPINPKAGTAGTVGTSGGTSTSAGSRPRTAAGGSKATSSVTSTSRRRTTFAAPARSRNRDAKPPSHRSASNRAQPAPTRGPSGATR